MTEATPEKPPILAAALPTSQLVRYFHAVVFAGIWMATGWVFHLDVNSYLLVGFPLMVVFQLLVCKEPQVSLWVRNEEQFRWSRLGLVFDLAMAILPAVRLVQSCRMGSWLSCTPQILWLVC